MKITKQIITPTKLVIEMSIDTFNALVTLTGSLNSNACRELYLDIVDEQRLKSFYIDATNEKDRLEIN